MDEGGPFKLRATAGAAAFGVTAAMIVVSIPGLGQPRVQHFATLMAAWTLAATGSRFVGRSLLVTAWRRGHMRAAALVFGDDALAREMAVEIGIRPERGVDIVGFVSTNPNRRHRRLADLPVFAVDPAADRARLADALEHATVAACANRLIIGPAGVGEHLAQSAARWAAAHGMPVHVVPRFFEMGMGLDAAMSPDIARGYPLVRLQRSAHPTLSLKVKRLLDIVVSGSALVIALPELA